MSGRERGRAGLRFLTLATIAAVAVACTPAPQGPNLDPPPVPRVIGLHQIGPNLGPEVDAFFANDFADVFRNRRAIYVTVQGAPVIRRYNHSTPGSAYDVGAIGTAIVATLVGIAVSEHRLAGVDQTVFELLPSYRAVMAPRIRGVTLGQLLSMTAGLPADDPVGPSRPELASVASILAAGPDQPPGEFAYSSRGALLVSAILSQAVGGSVLAYAQQRLFDRLGILPADTGDALRLTVTDLARIGQLWLARGAYGGRQVVPALWMNEMTRAWAPTGVQDAPAFGYGFWLTSADRHDAFAASGLGGQLVEIVPDLDLVTVVQSATDLDVLGSSQLYAVGAAEYIQLVDTVIAPAVS